jgi:hypothetical protein
MSKKAKRQAEKYGPWPYRLIMERNGVEVARKVVQAYSESDAEACYGSLMMDPFDEEISFRAERLDGSRT